MKDDDNNSDAKQKITKEKEKRKIDEKDIEDNEDDSIQINFTQFFHLLLRITEIVYPEIYSVNSVIYEPNSVICQPLSGPSKALEKIIKVRSL